MIDNFELEEYHFLSNFYEHQFKYMGWDFATSEHAYQAMKATSTKDLEFVAAAETPAGAKKRGRKIKCRDNWDKEKYEVMKSIIQVKFFSSIALSTLLIETENETLVEGNWWGDTYWGVCKGGGENKLGYILMEVRDTLNKFI